MEAYHKKKSHYLKYFHFQYNLIYVKTIFKDSTT